ncbi:MAG: PilZ domain-containing protein [Deltaproteobacteria bacterium]|nr:PilZ domain-containing protein [Deltaproteobacteria bacterium]
MVENREFSRVSFEYSVEIYSDENNKISEGIIKNISMSGMLAALTPLPDVNAQIFISIVLHDKKTPSPISIRIKGEVLRTGKTHAAIRFDLSDITLDSLTHLKNVVSYNLGDSDIVMDEILNSSKIAIS